MAVAALAAALLVLSRAQAIDNGLGARPGIGWNSDYCSNCLGALVDERGVIRGLQNDAFVRHIADFLVSSGLAALGYVNVNSDAGWNTFERDAAGNLVPDPALWPDGLNATIAYVHSKGLRFGLYGDRGTLDCSKRPGQLGHEAGDAAFMASLGVDWFKEDSCYAAGDQATAFEQYGRMRDALNATGRPIWFALCGWETFYAPAGQQLGNSWRIGEDTGSGWGAVMSNVNAMLTLARYAGPTAGGGGYNDMSLLLLPGMGSGANIMTRERHRSQFSLHCVFGANMLMTGNLSSIDPYALETWGNPEAVAVNQDPHYQPFLVLTPEPNASSAGDATAYVDAYVAECGGEPTLQNWTFGAPASQFLWNAASDQCLNVESCGSTIIYDSCTTTGSTCAGPGKFSNEQWALRADGALVSALPGARCTTVQADGTLVLAACSSPLPANQTWTYDTATGQLQSGGGLCLTAATQPGPPGASSLLIGRKLSTGSWAVVALNNSPLNATITCGSACFAAMGLAPTQQLRVRDLWAHTDVATTPATSYAMMVGPAGASTFLSFTPIDA